MILNKFFEYFLVSFKIGIILFDFKNILELRISS